MKKKIRFNLYKKIRKINKKKKEILTKNLVYIFERAYLVWYIIYYKFIWLDIY